MPLYVVATPIGNLQDLTARARDVLAKCDAVVAEDTRYTGQLLKHLGIEKKPFHSLPGFDEAHRADAIVARLAKGASFALVTDAGTPAISDPGAMLVRRAVEQGVPVVPVPGPSAAIAAVSVSGFVQPSFHFAGFLPRKSSARAALLSQLRPLNAQLVFYESPHRLAGTLRELTASLGDRPALVARELTKIHEELARGTLSELAARFSRDVRGEIVIVVSGPRSELGRTGAHKHGDVAHEDTGGLPHNDARQFADHDVRAAAHEHRRDFAHERARDLDAEVRKRLARGERPKEIAQALSARFSKRDVYQLALKLKKE